MMKKNLLFALLAFFFLQCYICKAQNKKEVKSENVSVKIDTLLTPEIGGIKQVVEIKTDDSKKPILLFLSGGPGASMMNTSNNYTDVLKNRFTIVHWDQRDAGKTLELNSSPSQPSVEQMGKDTYEVISFLTKELNHEKIYLSGISWGNILGSYIVKNHPELLHAYFAISPVISQLASEMELLKILKIHFKENPLASKELASVTFPFKSYNELYYLRKWAYYKGGYELATSDGFKNYFLHWSETWPPVWQEVMNIDLPKTLKEVDCPVYFFVGKNDVIASTDITVKYFEELKAPRKDLFLFEKSAHDINNEDLKKIQNVIIETLETILSEE